ncbi:MAG: helix-turn-helix domain-containing protein [Actinomycetota bacterium]
MKRTPSQEKPEDEYLRAAQVARLLHVSPKTVARWAMEGKLRSVRTLGGHRRFSAIQIRELAEQLAHES